MRAFPLHTDHPLPLAQVIASWAEDASLAKRVHKTLDLVKQDALFTDFFSCPQSPTFHAEGPMLRDHVTSALRSVFAFASSWSPADIEEISSACGYAPHLLQDVKKVFTDETAWCLVFALCHDLGKPFALQFSSPAGSLGASLGMNGSPREGERASLRARYGELYQTFAAEYGPADPQELQSAFYLRYQIDIHYPHHAAFVWRQDIRERIAWLARVFDLPERDAALLPFFIQWHRETLFAFSKRDVAAARLLRRQAEEHGCETERVAPLILATLLMDTVCASFRLGPAGVWMDARPFVNAFSSFEEGASASSIRARQEQQKRQQTAVWQRFHLDGDSLKTLLQMEASPRFGTLLASIHAAALKGTALPPVSPRAQLELKQRVAAYRASKGQGFFSS